MRAPQAIDNCSSTVLNKCKEKGLNISLDDIAFVVRRFIHYMRLSIINGYKISIHRQQNVIMAFSLCYKILQKTTKQDKGKYFLSSRLLGFMFYINVKSGRVGRYNLNFTPNDEFASMIQEQISTDLAYKFIGR